MNFEAFAADHGLIIRSLVMDKWTRVPTVDHPHKRNGAYIWDGERGAVQNWAVHDSPICWAQERSEPVDYEKIRLRAEKAAKEREEAHKVAASRASKMLKQAIPGTHLYLARKGFPAESGWIWRDKLLIPMRVGPRLVGLQLISGDGEKKFLKGQVTHGAAAVFDNKGGNIFVEGYATAMSVRRALKSVRMRYKIWVTFSAGNLTTVARGKTGIVVADNDAAGLQAAAKTGLLVWCSPKMGEDANDFEMRCGTEALAEGIRYLTEPSQLSAA